MKKQDIMREYKSKSGIHLIEYYDFGADNVEVNGIVTHRTFNDLLDELEKKDVMPRLF